MREGVIYSITCPVHNKIMYVGQTVDPKNRFRSYFQSGTTGNAIDLYVKSLVKKGLRPLFTIHLKCNEADLDKQEYELLDKFVSDGFFMLNRRNNSSDNYNSARELFMGIKKPEQKEVFDLIDLTIMQQSA